MSEQLTKGESPASGSSSAVAERDALTIEIAQMVYDWVNPNCPANLELGAKLGFYKDYFEIAANVIQKATQKLVSS